MTTHQKTYSEPPVSLSGELPKRPRPVPGCVQCTEEMAQYTADMDRGDFSSAIDWAVRLGRHDERH